MKIALVHDYLVQHGGAERVLQCFCEIFPNAPIYTLVYNKEIMRDSFSDRRIYTSSLQKFPFSKKWHRIFPPLMPAAIEEFDFSMYDVVLSDSSSYAKGIITGANTLHICYTHTPMRYAWDDCQEYTDDFYYPKFVKVLIPFMMNYIRVWDGVGSDRVDKYLANSEFVARRIKKYYKKNATVINPPVDIKNFSISNKTEDYFLMVGRLISYKKHNVAIEAFNKLGLPLKIIGRGPELQKLKKQAKSNIEFLERVNDEEITKYYSECKAFIFPQEEDFGIVAIEALAAGRPIIAFQGGDIVEHIEDGNEGVFFDKQTPESLIEAVKRFDGLKFDSQHNREVALKFDREIFKGKIKEYVEKEIMEFQSGKIESF
ncbi:MAG: glycosyltransferase [Candidatus Moranbacteria bacterium]|nr:glycosyltransferase [Candidatus Moranbacteria bacterium]